MVAVFDLAASDTLAASIGRVGRASGTFEQFHKGESQGALANLIGTRQQIGVADLPRERGTLQQRLCLLVADDRSHQLAPDPRLTLA
jgi:hypothetical protein